MVTNNNEGFPLQSDGIFLSRQLSKKTTSSSSSSSNNMGAASFRVYYGGENVNVPFMWESKPGTPKHNGIVDEDSTMPPLTPPPPSYLTKMLPIKRSSSSRSNSFINSLAKFAPKIRPWLSSSSPSSRSSSSSESSWKSISTYSPSRIFRKSRSIWFDHGLDKEEIRSYIPTPSLCFGLKMQR